MSWILVWAFLGYSGTLETRIPFASVKEVVLNSESQCQEALASQLNVNDTRYIIAHGDGKLVCVQVPLKWDIAAGKIR